MSKNTLLDTLLNTQPDADVFLVTPEGETLTYGVLRSRVAQTAGHLIAAGVTPGDRVLCQIEKSPQGLILYLATVAAGGVFVPLNTGYIGAEIDYFLEDAEPALLILDASTEGARDVAKARGVRVATPKDLTADGPEAAPVPRGPDDLAGILYTSGTTGRSKGAMLTHDNLISNAKVLTDLWRFTRDDTLLHALPIFHTHGLFVATNVILCAGARMVFLPAFNVDALAHQLPRCTAIMGVPTFYTRMLDDPRFTRDTLAHMRLIISGSAPLLAESHKAFEEQTGHAILERYGMTETNMITSNPYDGARRAGTVGMPSPGVSLRIAQPDEKGIGGIEVRGPNVTKGYWRNPEKTDESFTKDGWFITGDLGQMDEDGYLSIVGRQKDLVISGGFNVYPKEVEVQIDDLPGVLESAVYGVPHPDLGEAVAAAVVLNDAAETDADTIIAALADRLARYKIPRTVRILPELPRNTMGKVQKNILRDEAAHNA
ncbi:AMP-binding protein [Gymnodinialimonas hymeniacidonis]|uniref:AMP-binding protein n=1 Tax=Gymnodinialimonas hymeniacidonis TaxID=3126508 RepID=UPI0034C637FF